MKREEGWKVESNGDGAEREMRWQILFTGTVCHAKGLIRIE